MMPVLRRQISAFQAELWAIGRCTGKQALIFPVFSAYETDIVDCAALKYRILAGPGTSIYQGRSNRPMEGSRHGYGMGTQFLGYLVRPLRGGVAFF